jgi:hypothetical protein
MLPLSLPFTYFICNPFFSDRIEDFVKLILGPKRRMGPGTERGEIPNQIRNKMVICGLLHEAVIISDCIASNCRITNE